MGNLNPVGHALRQAYWGLSLGFAVAADRKLTYSGGLCRLKNELGVQAVLLKF
jgi:hypothetical protein